MALGSGFSFLHHPLLVEAKAAWGQCGDGSPDPSAWDDARTSWDRLLLTKGMKKHGGRLIPISLWWRRSPLALAAVLGKRSETERKMSQGSKEEFLVSLPYNKRQ